MKTMHSIELMGPLIMRSFHKTFVFSLVSLFVLTACQPYTVIILHSAPAWKAATIELQPTGVPTLVGPPGTININSGNNGCINGAGAKKGCVRFAQDELGTLTFKLHGAPGPKSCGAPGAPNVITKIRLTDTDAGGGAVPSAKGDFTAGRYPLPIALKDEGFPELTIANGVVYKATALEFGLNEITISNINGHDASLGTVNFWYEVTVSRCSDGAVWATDPRGENEGMN